MRGRPTIGSQFFEVFHSDRISKATKMTMYISLLTVAIPVSYMSEFLYILPANSGTF